MPFLTIFEDGSFKELEDVIRLVELIVQKHKVVAGAHIKAIEDPAELTCLYDTYERIVLLERPH